MELIGKLKIRFQQGDLATRLIYINVGVYLFLIVLNLANLSNQVLPWLTLSASSNLDFIYKPWTLITYYFLHIDFMHLLFNMIMLYVMGQFFYRNFTDSAFAKFYFLGGIAGGLLFICYCLIFNQYNTLLGASAAIYSVFFAMAAYQPNLQIRLLFLQTPLKLLHVAIGFLVLGFLIQPSNIGGNIAHLGGALFGYFYMKKFEKGNDLFSSLFDALSRLFKAKPNLKTYSKKGSSQKPPTDDYEYNEWKHNQQEKVDAILDKISRSGYNSLTPEEKDFLFKQGKQK